MRCGSAVASRYLPSDETIDEATLMSLSRFQQLEEHLEAFAAAQVADEIDEREADVDVLSRARRRSTIGSMAGSPMRTSASVDELRLPAFSAIGKRVEQSVDDLRPRVAHETVDDGLAHAPVLVAEELEHERQVALVRRLRDERRPPSAARRDPPNGPAR